MNRKQAKTLIKQILWGPLPEEETQLKWLMLIVDALSGTGGDDEYEYLKKRFSRALPTHRYYSLGGCTAPLAAA